MKLPSMQKKGMWGWAELPQDYNSCRLRVIWKKFSFIWTSILLLLNIKISKLKGVIIQNRISSFDFYNWTVVGFWPRLTLTLSSAPQIDLLWSETYVKKIWNLFLTRSLGQKSNECSTIWLNTYQKDFYQKTYMSR